MRYSARRRLTALTVISPPRSDGHNAGEPAAAGISGRASLTHWPRMSSVHGQTASTLRGFGDEPLRALPNRTRQTPKSPNSRACGLMPKSATSSIVNSVRRNP